MYFLITWLRNLLYDLGWLKSHSFAVPATLSVGNLTVGGTGKTPHIEHFIRKYLAEGKRVAVLSRGYKRQTKGFLVASANSTAYTVGDEPYQLYRKFPQIKVAVDSDRVNGIKQLMNLAEKPDVVLLDDAFQHRRLKPQRQVLLVDYNRPIFRDRVMPYGRLRESRKGLKRADEVIVTKCPQTLSESEKESWREQLGVSERQTLRFSTFEFFPPKNVFTQEALDLSQKYDFQVVTGVVSPESLYRFLESYSNTIYKTKFPDHHFFTAKDIDFINQEAEAGRIVVVTEKDAARLVDEKSLSATAKRSIYAVEIRVKFI